MNTYKLEVGIGHSDEGWYPMLSFDGERMHGPEAYPTKAEALTAARALAAEFVIFLETVSGFGSDCIDADEVTS